VDIYITHHDVTKHSVIFHNIIFHVISHLIYDLAFLPILKRITKFGYSK